MQTIKVILEMPKVDGFKYTGEYRYPKEGEYWLQSTGIAFKADCDLDYSFPILSKEDEYDYIDPFKAKDEYLKNKRVEYLHDCGNWIPLPLILNEFDYAKKYRVRLNKNNPITQQRI